MYRTLQLRSKKQMLQTKIMWAIADFFGGGSIVLGILTNLDNIKSAILFILGSIYAMVRVYYTIVQKNQAVREKEYELWNKEMDKKEREANHQHKQKRH